MADKRRNQMTLTHQTRFIDRAGAQILRCIYGDGAETPAPRYRVLVVDDEPEMLTVFKHLFRTPQLSHCDVKTADCVNQAMALIAANCFDLAILDYRLGRSETAAELVCQWRSFGYELPFVCVSGYPDAELASRALGAVDFLPKSDITPERLAQVVRRAVAASFRSA